MITIRFACGHQLYVPDTIETAPQCICCGETRVRFVAARPPRFTGAGQGPLMAKETSTKQEQTHG